MYNEPASFWLYWYCIVNGIIRNVLKYRPPKINVQDKLIELRKELKSEGITPQNYLSRGNGVVVCKAVVRHRHLTRWLATKYVSSNLDDYSKIRASLDKEAAATASEQVQAIGTNTVAPVWNSVMDERGLIPYPDKKLAVLCSGEIAFVPKHTQPFDTIYCLQPGNLQFMMRNATIGNTTDTDLDFMNHFEKCKTGYGGVDISEQLELWEGLTIPRFGTTI